MIDELVHRSAVAKAHLDLGRMHVHVHGFGRQLQAQHIGGEAVAVQHVFVSAAHGVGEQAVAHEAAVDVEELVVRPAARGGRQAGKAEDA